MWSISFDKTGTRLASCSDDKTVKIWKEYLPGNQQGIVTVNNDPTWKCVCTLSGHHNRPVYDISWCHQTGILATGCGDDAIRLFKEDPSASSPDEPSFENFVTVHKAHSMDINAVTWNPKVEGLLASCSDDGEIKLWQYTDG